MGFETLALNRNRLGIEFGGAKRKSLIFIMLRPRYVGACMDIYATQIKIGLCFVDFIEYYGKLLLRMQCITDCNDASFILLIKGRSQD